MAEPTVEELASRCLDLHNQGLEGELSVANGIELSVTLNQLSDFDPLLDSVLDIIAILNETEKRKCPEFDEAGEPCPFCASSVLIGHCLNRLGKELEDG